MTNAWIAAGLIALALNGSVQAAGLETARTAQGAVASTPGAAPGVRVFKGIPYAKPPTGPLRWLPPEPAAGWKGVRAGDAYGPMCMQPAFEIKARPGLTDRSDLFIPDRTQPMSEDCLYLNVWTPAAKPKSRLPVMVYIHGGGFTTGAAYTPMQEPSRLATKGVVVVALNYRLGAFGFLDHPELATEGGGSSGGYGLMDQIEALRWVQRNIAAFGGDASRVTIFGGSAGSMSVNMLAASPLAKGLFQGGVAESGTGFGRPGMSVSQADAQAAGVKFFAALAVHDLAEARAAPAQAVLAAQIASHFQGRPSIGGRVLPLDIPTTYARGLQNDVAIIVGWNADEDRILAPQPPGGDSARAFEAMVRQRFGAQADTVLGDYPAVTDADAARSAGRLFTDGAFGAGAARWGQTQAATGKKPVFVYYFAHPAPIAPDVSLFGRTAAELGATHGGEMYYVSDILDALPWPWTQRDREIARTLQDYWVNFARRGDPNGPGVPGWEPVDAQGAPKVLLIDGETRMIPLPRAASMALLAPPAGAP